MNVGNLTIEIAANVARLQADMNEAKRAVTSATKDMEQALGFLKTAFIGLTGVTGAIGLKNMVDSVIEGKAHLYDLSLQTGMTVEALSALGKAGKLSHTSLDDVAGASNKLSKALATSNEDSKGAALAIEALGLNFTQFKGLAPEQQMLTVAKAMEEFKDGSGKSAAAMLLFGKTGAQLLPFMKELAEQNTLVGRETTAGALAAKQYEDNLIKLHTAGDAWKKQLVDDILPSLVNVTNQLLAGRKAYGGFIAAGIDSMNINSFATTNENISAAIKRYKELEEQAERAKATQAGRSGLAASLFGGSDAQDLQNIRDQQKVLDQRVAYLRELQKGEGGGRSAIDPRAPAKTGVDIDADLVARMKEAERLRKQMAADAAAEAKRRLEEFNHLIGPMREKLAIDQMEIDLGRSLTAGEREALTVMVEIRDGKLKLNDTRKREVMAVLEQRAATEQLNKARAAEAKWLEESRKETQQTLDAEAKRLQQLQEAGAAAQRQLDEFGKTREQLQAMASDRDRDSAALLRQRAAALDDVGAFAQLRDFYQQTAEQLERNAKLKDELAAKEANERQDPYAGASRAVKKYLDDVKNAGNATEQAIGSAIGGLENTLTDFVSKGKADFGRLFDSIIADALRLKVIKPLLAEAFGGAGGGGGGSSDIGLFMQGIQAFAGFGGGGLNVDYGGAGTNLTGGGLPTSGGRAAGGPVGASRAFMVGESGPELFVPATAGQIVPNAGGASITLAPMTTINIDSRSDAASIRQQVSKQVADGNRALVEQLRAQGALR